MQRLRHLAHRGAQRLRQLRRARAVLLAHAALRDALKEALHHVHAAVVEHDGEAIVYEALCNVAQLAGRQ
eukprot:175028-Chlamydomonas_euryale.AAC.1